MLVLICLLHHVVDYQKQGQVTGLAIVSRPLSEDEAECAEMKPDLGHPHGMALIPWAPGIHSHPIVDDEASMKHVRLGDEDQEDASASGVEKGVHHDDRRDAEVGRRDD